MSETKLHQEYMLIDVPDLNRLRIGDQVRVIHPEYEAEWRHTNCIVIGIELSRSRLSKDQFEQNITILHDVDQVTDSFKVADLHKVAGTEDASHASLVEENRRLTQERDEARNSALEEAARAAAAIHAPKSIGRDKGRHHEAGAQSAARAIRALTSEQPVDGGMQGEA